MQPVFIVLAIEAYSPTTILAVFSNLSAAESYCEKHAPDEGFFLRIVESEVW